MVLEMTLESGSISGVAASRTVTLCLVAPTWSVAWIDVEEVSRATPDDPARSL